MCVTCVRLCMCSVWIMLRARACVYFMSSCGQRCFCLLLLFRKVMSIETTRVCGKLFSMFSFLQSAWNNHVFPQTLQMLFWFQQFRFTNLKFRIRCQVSSRCQIKDSISVILFRSKTSICNTSSFLEHLCSRFCLSDIACGALFFIVLDLNDWTILLDV